VIVRHKRSHAGCLSRCSELPIPTSIQLKQRGMEEIIVAGTAAEVVRGDDAGAAASEVRQLEKRVRELERLLGRKTTEVATAVVFTP